MIKAIIFDCFGVLVGNGFQYTYCMAGGDPSKDREYINNLLGQANLGLITPIEFEESIIKQLAISNDDWQRALVKAEQPNRELLEYIDQLHKTYKTAVLSNANLGSVEYSVGSEWLDKCFDAVVVSAEVGMVKPYPEIYRYAAHQLGVQPQECVFIDDHEGYLSSAREEGMDIILYTGFTEMKQQLEELLADTKG